MKQNDNSKTERCARLVHSGVSGMCAMEHMIQGVIWSDPFVWWTHLALTSNCHLSLVRNLGSHQPEKNTTETHKLISQVPVPFVLFSQHAYRLWSF